MIGDDIICQLVLGYLREHPHAGDTLEGIREWWMFRQRLNDSAETVQRVLEQLKKTGAIHERKTASGRTLYFANHPRQSSGGESLLTDEDGPNESNE
jgi:Fe2+ or Zn2+ uptake regulation protein